MNLWSTFLDLDKLHESTDDKRWTDQALDELKNKPKSDWTADDWDTFHYCKNANAERDYYDSLDEDFYDFEPVNTNSWVKMPPAQNSTVANKAYVNKALAPSSVYVVSTRKTADLQQPDFCEFEQGDVWYGAVEYVDKLTNTTGHFGSLYDAVAAAKKNNKYFDFFIYEYDTSVNKLTLVGKVDKAANQPTTPSTNQPARSSTASSKPIVTIVKDSGKLRALAANGDGQGNPAAFVQFPTALRTNEGQQYEVDQLVWTGKFYRVAGKINPIITNVTASTTSTQNITENINKENSKMNFNSVFEELNKLYENKPAAEVKPEQVEGEVKEEPVEEGCAKEALKEAADDEIEFAEEPVDVIPEEETEEAAEEDVNTVEEFLKSFGEYDGKLKLEFKPIIIDGKEYQVTGIIWDDSEEGKLVAEVTFDMPEEGEEPVEEEPVEEALQLDSKSAQLNALATAIHKAFEAKNLTDNMNVSTVAVKCEFGSGGHITIQIADNISDRDADIVKRYAMKVLNDNQANAEIANIKRVRGMTYVILDNIAMMAQTQAIKA